MSCQFSIPFVGNADEVLAKARSAVQSQGGNFNGDTNSGEFLVSAFGNRIAGAYTVSGQTLSISVTDKPFLLPCSAIEGFLKGQLR